jgi:hypothetical protein
MPNAAATKPKTIRSHGAFSAAWPRIDSDGHKTLNRFWRHSDLIEVKNRRSESQQNNGNLYIG